MEKKIKVELLEYFKLLGSYLMQRKMLFFLTGIFLLTDIALQLCNPQILKYFVDSALAGKAVSQLTLIGLLFFGISIIQNFFTIGATYTGQNLAWQSTNELRKDLAEHCVMLDMDFHTSRPRGQLIERIDGDIERLAVFFSDTVIRVIISLLLIIGVLLLLFGLNPLIGTIFSVFSLLSIYLLYKNKDFVIPKQVEIDRIYAESVGYIEERISSAEDLKANGAIDFIMIGFYKIARRMQSAVIGVTIRMTGINAIRVFYTTGNLVIAFILCYYLFNQKQITLGSAFIVVYYVNLINRPIFEMVNQFQSLQGVGASVHRVNELFSIRPTVKNGSVELSDTIACSLEFQDVSFNYTSDQTVLEQINFNIRENHILGIIGKTGSGKTTLSRLIFRLYETNKGQILINNTDIREYTIESLRKHIALVTQDVQIFHASIRDNLSFFNPEINDDRIMEAFRQLHLSDWFRKLPDGLDTQLGTGNLELSSGEEQLLALARVFLKDAKLVILDEASSRLDPANERLLETSMQNLLKDRTAIIIAHRLRTILKADSILIVEKGKVKEFGTLENLMTNKRSFFSSLLKTGFEEVLV